MDTIPVDPTEGDPTDPGYKPPPDGSDNPYGWWEVIGGTWRWITNPNPT